MKAVQSKTKTETVKSVKQDTFTTHFPKLIIIWGNYHNAENYALLGYYTACSGNSLQTFWDNLSVPFQGS